VICPPCKAAGRTLRETEVIYQNLRTGTQSLMTGAQAAAAMHGACESPVDCPCQHRTERAGK
jgi:hypothetical protein